MKRIVLPWSGLVGVATGLLALNLVLLFTGCATQEKPPVLPSILPPPIDAKSLLGPESEPVECNTKAPTFEPVLLNDSHVLEDSGTQLRLQAGYLVDECTFAKGLIETPSTLKRVTKERDVLAGLRTKEHKQVREGEKAYQGRIQYLEKKAERSWWENHKLEVGLGSGMVLAAVVVSLLWVNANNVKIEVEIETAAAPP
jgi:hypothetical protein